MADIKKFLDQAGTQHLWSRIAEELDKKTNDSDLKAIAKSGTAADVAVVDEANKIAATNVEAALLELINKIETVEANGYDDTALAAKVNANESAIATLNGTGEGSVANAISTAIAGVVNGAPEAFDTLKEIADWIANTAGDDDTAMTAAEIITKINALEAAIGNGGSVATQIDDAIEDALKDESGNNIYATAADHTALAGRVTTAEGKITALEADTHTHTNKDVLDGITSAKVTAWDASEQNAKDYADSLATNYATAAQGAKADSALQDADVIALTTSEINAAIAAAKSAAAGE